MANVKVKVIIEVNGERVAKSVVKGDVVSKSTAHELANDVHKTVNDQYSALAGRFGI